MVVEIFRRLRDKFRGSQCQEPVGKSELVKDVLTSEQLRQEIQSLISQYLGQQASPAYRLGLPFFNTSDQLLDRFGLAINPSLSPAKEHLIALRQPLVDELVAKILAIGSLEEQSDLTTDLFRTTTLLGDRTDLREVVALVLQRLAQEDKNENSTHRPPFLFLGASSVHDFLNYDGLPDFSHYKIESLLFDKTSSIVDAAHLVIVAPARFIDQNDSFLKRLSQQIKIGLRNDKRRLTIDLIEFDFEPGITPDSIDQHVSQVETLTLDQTLTNWQTVFSSIKRQLESYGYTYEPEVFIQIEQQYLNRVTSAYQVALGSRPLLETLVQAGTELETDNCLNQDVLIATLDKYLQQHNCGLSRPGDLNSDPHTLQALMLMSQQIDARGNLRDGWEKQAFPFLSKKEACSLELRLRDFLRGNMTLTSSNPSQTSNSAPLLSRRGPGRDTPYGVDTGLVRLLAWLRDVGYMPDKSLFLKPEAVGKIFAFVCPRCGNNINGVVINASGQVDASGATGCNCGCGEPPEIKYL